MNPITLSPGDFAAGDTIEHVDYGTGVVQVREPYCFSPKVRFESTWMYLTDISADKVVKSASKSIVPLSLMKGLTALADDVHAANKAKGFYDTPTSIAERVALIHSEVSDILEADQGAKVATNALAREALSLADPEDFKSYFKTYLKDTVADEIADTMIRCLDLAGAEGIDIGHHIAAKLRYNSLRPGNQLVSKTATPLTFNRAWPGDRVKHPEYGEGVIEKLDRSDNSLKVNFDAGNGIWFFETVAHDAAISELVRARKS